MSEDLLKNHGLVHDSSYFDEIRSAATNNEEVRVPIMDNLDEQLHAIQDENVKLTVSINKLQEKMDFQKAESKQGSRRFYISLVVSLLALAVAVISLLLELT